MTGIDSTHAYWKLCQGEHQEICAQLQVIHGLLDAEQTTDGQDVHDELKLRLTELLTHLETHFAQEEEGGYMEEALARAPRFSSLAAELEKQHAPMLARLRGLLARADESPTRPTRAALAVQARELCQLLARHEASETRILQMAFNRDPILDDDFRL